MKRTLKKLGAVLLVLCMVMTMLPVTAFAAPVTGSLTIGGTTVDLASNQSGDTNWSWNAALATLTLTGNIGGDGKIGFIATGDITVTVTGTVNASRLYHNSASAGKLTINGNGTLNLSYSGNDGSTISTVGELEITNVTINASMTGSGGWSCVFIDNGNFNMTSGKLNLSSTGANSGGVSCNTGSINISGTAEIKTSPSVTHNALKADGINMGDSAVVDVVSTSEIGILSYTYIFITGGTVTTSGNNAMGGALYATMLGTTITGGTVATGGNIQGTILVNSGNPSVTVNGTLFGNLTVGSADADVTVNGGIGSTTRTFEFNVSGGTVTVTGTVNGTSNFTGGTVSVGGVQVYPAAGGDTPPTATNVNANAADPLVGTQLTATYTYNAGTGTGAGTDASTFKWYRSTAATWGGATPEEISGATAITYTPTGADVGKYLYFEVTPTSETLAGTAVQSAASGQAGIMVSLTVTANGTTGTATIGGGAGPVTVVSTTSPTVTATLNDAASVAWTVSSGGGTFGNAEATSPTYALPAMNTSVTAPITITATFTAIPAPTITSANSTTFTVGTEGSFTVTANNSPTSFAVSGTLPTGVTFNTATGALSGTPSAGTASTYNLSFTATNGGGTSTPQSFTLTVNPAPAVDININATNFPDDNFRAWLTDSANIGGVGTDNVLTAAEIAAITSMNVSGESISNLTGIGYFTALTQLYCYDNSLTALPALPDSLTLLNCGNENLTTLPALPSGLIDLNCNSSSLTTLPAPLPAGLEVLRCSSNSLNALPALPSSLTLLECYNNNLTALPALLPNSLTVLSCGNDNLTALPALPDSLTWLNCNGSNLTELPALLPSSLTLLECNNNNLTALPALPDSLTLLECNNNNLTALPVLPASLDRLTCNNNNLTELVLNSSVTYNYIYAQNNYMTDTSAVTGQTIDWKSADGLSGNASYEFYPQRTPTSVTFTAAQTGGISGTANSSGIALTFSQAVTGLTADKITITGAATKGTLSGSGTAWTIALSGVTTEGDVTVSIANFGAFHVTNSPLTVEVFKGITKTITFHANGGSVSPTSAQTGADGKLSSLPTPTRSGSYSFSGWFTLASGGTAVTTATEFTDNTEIYAHWTYTGGGGGGGGGTPVVTPPAQPTTETTTTGNTATATTTATATVNSSGTATATVTQAQVSEAIAKAAEAAAKQGGGTAAIVEIKVEAPADAKTVETSIPKAAMEQAADGKTAALTVSSPVASLSFDAAALSTIAGEATGAVNISASIVDASTLSAETQQLIGDRPVFNFSVTSGGQTISQFGGSVSVSVPYSPKAGEDLNAIVIYYINAEGKPEVVSNCSYDPATGTISFKTDHFSQYTVGYNKVTFKDVAENAWYSKAVSFIAAREITTGTGNGNYSPDAKLTRGEFIVMLMKAYGIAPDTATADNFADAGNTWYTGYLAAAKRLGISGGVGNNMFAPGKEITRQEMFTLLYNALKAIGQLPESNTGKSLSAFSDAGQVASWAKDAMTLLVKTGTVSGSGGKLTPEETTTRAQMAQVLYNLMSE